MSERAPLGAALLTALSCAGAAAAQAQGSGSATSPVHVLRQSGHTDGTTSQSTKYRLESSLGGLGAVASTSKNFRLDAGLPSVLATTAGRPWVTSVSPPSATMLSQTTLTLHGSDLDVGTNPTVRIGGFVAAVASRSRDAITTVLPIQPEPGYQPIEVTNDRGTTVLPRGLAILPLVETRPAAASGLPFELVFRGTKGDQVLWAMGIGRAATPLAVPGALYGFSISPTVYLVYSGFSISDAGGELRLRIPPQTYPTGTVFVQGLFLTQNAGYGPAAFSNVLNL